MLIVIDALRRDHLGAYGYPRGTSPRIDTLAREGATFPGLSPTSWTKPAVASILTGLHPLRHQAFAESDAIPPEVPTLAEILKNSGFRTLGVASNAWLSQAWGFDRGFDRYVPVWKVANQRFPKSEEVNRQVRAHLDELRPPFFLFVHYLDPHQPYDPSLRWDGRPLSPEAAALRPLRLDTPGHRSGDDTTRLMLLAQELYDGEIRETDRCVGELLDLLGTRGLAESTLVVLTADHGEEFMEHGNVGHGKSLYREVTDVPLVFYLPGEIRPGDRRTTRSTISITPTILDALGIVPQAGVEADFDAASVREALLNSSDEARSDSGQLLHLDLDGNSALAYEAGSTKVLLSRVPWLKALFAIDKDPGETQNVFTLREQSAEVARMSADLAGSYNELVRRSHRRSSAAVDREMTERLRALGYLNASDGRSSERAFPRRLRVADGAEDGFSGWENPDSISPCAATAEMSPDQLFDGFFPPELGGRWTAPRARFAVPHSAPRVNARIEIQGRNFRRAPFQLEVSVRGVKVISERIAGEDFRSRGSVNMNLPTNERLTLEIAASPEFLPLDLGLPDARRLGTFLTRICFEEAKAGSPSDAGKSSP